MRPCPMPSCPLSWRSLRALPGLAARALEFTILTAARTGEARFARWSEIDLRHASGPSPASG